MLKDNIAYLHFNKGAASCGILLENLAAHILERCALCWTKNWLDGQAQGMMVNSAASSWHLTTDGIPQG